LGAQRPGRPSLSAKKTYAMCPVMDERPDYAVANPEIEALRKAGIAAETGPEHFPALMAGGN